MGKVTKGFVNEDGEWVTTETTVEPEKVEDPPVIVGQPKKERTYRILEGNTDQDLMIGVAVWIDLGWKPLGGVQVIKTGQDKLTFYQAIIKADVGEVLVKNDTQAK